MDIKDQLESELESGSDPYLGSFDTGSFNGSPSDLDSAPWLPRTSPTFTSNQVWLNGWMMTWQSGSLTSDGTVTDTYADASGEFSFMITGAARDYAQGNGTYQFIIEGQTYDSEAWALSAEGPTEPSTQPYFLPDQMSLWVGGSKYDFEESTSYSYDDHLDRYLNASLGYVLLGAYAGATHVAGNLGTQFFSGELLSDGTFSVTPAVEILTTGPIQPLGPDSLWVHGKVYTREVAEGSPLNTFADSSNSGVLTIEAGTGQDTWLISGSDGLGWDFSGTVSNTQTGVFLLNAQNDTSTAFWPALAAQTDLPEDANDGLFLGAGGEPSGMPSAISLQGSILVYLGTTTEDKASDKSAGYYGVMYANGCTQLMKIRQLTEEESGPAVVTLSDYSSGADQVGTYDLQSFLFQTANAAADSLPAPLYVADATSNHDRVEAAVPTDSNLPPSFIVNGQPWWYAGEGTDAQGNPISMYRGFYTGQVMTLGALDDFNQRLVTLMDPVHNANAADPFQTTEGTLSSARSSVRLRDGTVALSGNATGAQVAVQTADDFKLQTIAADLDIVGNTISFGILQGDASLAAALFEFADVPDDSNAATPVYTATLRNALSRPLAQWEWNRSVDDTTQDTLTMMKLDPSHKLSLYNPDDPSSATIKLNPKTDQVSELPKLRLNNQTLDAETSVLTQGLGDSRYLRTTGGTQSIAITGGINVNTDGTYAAAIGQNLQAASGQVVVGRNNTAVADDVFVVGAGTTSQAKNALTVSTSGDTHVTGDFTVDGSATINGQFVASQPSVFQASLMAEGIRDPVEVVTNPLTTKIIAKPGQEILVPEQGDISMGDFRSGPLPVANP